MAAAEVGYYQIPPYLPGFKIMVDTYCYNEDCRNWGLKHPLPKGADFDDQRGRRKPQVFITCDKCQEAYYCSQKCQQETLKAHAAACEHSILLRQQRNVTRFPQMDRGVNPGLDGKVKGNEQVWSMGTDSLRDVFSLIGPQGPYSIPEEDSIYSIGVGMGGPEAWAMEQGFLRKGSVLGVDPDCVVGRFPFVPTPFKDASEISGPVKHVIAFWPLPSISFGIQMDYVFRALGPDLETLLCVFEPCLGISGGDCLIKFIQDLCPPAFYDRFPEREGSLFNEEPEQTLQAYKALADRIPKLNLAYHKRGRGVEGVALHGEMVLFTRRKVDKPIVVRGLCTGQKNRIKDDQQRAGMMCVMN